MEVPWRREPLKEEGMEGWGVAQRMGALEGEGSWKAEGDPRRWRGPLSGANLSLEGGGGPPGAQAGGRGARAATTGKRGRVARWALSAELEGTRRLRQVAL